MPSIKLLDVTITPQRFEQAIDQLLNWAAGPAGRHFVCTCPVYTLMQARQDQRVRRALGAADMVAADGMPIVWLLRRKGYEAERVYGPDIVHALCERSRQQPQIRHYFIGGLPGVAHTMAQSLHTAYEITVCGTFSPSIQPIDAPVDPQIVEQINASDASIVWVGLGSPKQDLWMQQYRPYLNAPLLIGVGAAFDFIAGTKSQAPRWMQRSGLEWTFRLMKEPRRLWRRYVVFNTRFVLLVARRTLWERLRGPAHRSG